MTNNKLLNKLDEIIMLKKHSDGLYVMDKERLNRVNSSLRNAKYKYSFFNVEITDNNVIVRYNKTDVFNRSLLVKDIKESINIQDFTTDVIIEKIKRHMIW